ncbi:MAG: acetyltransferase [Dehalococcoidia bacterium]|nr:acetyltransferase [Dehalococcoidia bacterium]
MAAVVIFHADARWLPGGFLGVDLFFVISGFIITRALLGEWDRTGRIRIGPFWLRRARRLLPAVFLLIAATLLYTAAFARSDVARLREDTLAALLYATNWYQIAGGQSYFASLAPPSLLQHLWSLAVEEQFYVVWPLVLTGVIFVTPRRLLAPVIALGAGASMIEMAWLYQHGASISRLYYGTDTRAAGLLLGAAIACWPAVWQAGRRGAKSNAALQLSGWLSLAVIVAFWSSIDDSGAFLYNGGFALVSVAAASLIVAAVYPAGLLSRMLERAPLRWLGRRSYGIYLWHWPIFVLIQPQLSIPAGRLIMVAAQITTAVAVAALSYRFVEEPIRRGALAPVAAALRAQLARRRLTTVGALGAASAVTVAAAVWIVRVPAPQLPSYFGLTRVQITTVALSPTAVAPPLVRAQPSVGAPTSIAASPVATPTVAAPARTPLPPLPSPAPASASQSESSAASASLVYGPTAPAPARPLPAAASTRVTAIGDSVMLGAAQALAAVTPGIYVDAAVGRQVYAAIALMRQLEASQRLGGIVLIDMGNNGTFSDAQFEEIMSVAGPTRRVVFVNLKEPRSWEATNNAVIARGVARFPNAVLVDWYGASIDRPELFYSDSIHLRPEGAVAYAALIAPYISG